MFVMFFFCFPSFRSLFVPLTFVSYFVGRLFLPLLDAPFVLLFYIVVLIWGCVFPCLSLALFFFLPCGPLCSPPVVQAFGIYLFLGSLFW